MIGRHVEGPEIFLDLHTRRITGHDEAADAERVAVFARHTRKHEIMRRHMHARIPHFLAIDEPAINAVALLAHSACFHPCGVRAVIRLGKAEGNARRTVEATFNELLLLCRRTEIAEHQHRREIADNR